MKLRLRRRAVPLVLLSIVFLPIPEAGAAPGEVEGTFTANGEAVELPYVYVYEEAEGFYDESDPAWTVLFSAQPMEERDLDEFFIEHPYVKLSITRTAEFEGEPTLDVYSQNLKFPGADSNISGGTYPELELDAAWPDVLAGRVYHLEEQEFFDDTYSYDLTFSATLSDPTALPGEPLPAGGGEMGSAYLAWVDAIHALDIERLKTMVPPEMAAMLDEPDAMESLEFMKEMTPTDVEVLGGSQTPEMAILKVEGMMDGQKVTGEVTMTPEGGFWFPTATEWE